MNNKEKLYLAKVAGAMAGVDAGWVAPTLTDKVTGATSGVMAGLGATPIPVLNTQALQRTNKGIATMTGHSQDLKKVGLPTAAAPLDKELINQAAIKKDLEAKVPDYMRDNRTPKPQPARTAGL
jgi:hypothetical protein